MTKPLFRPGRIIGTIAAVKAMQEAGQEPNNLLDRHLKGDWGDAPDDIQTANEISVRSFFTTKRPKIFSAYHLASDLTVWVCTESDRSVTTFLLPEEQQLAKTQKVGPTVMLDTGTTRDLTKEKGARALRNNED